jgi:hypothetical protein
MRRLSVTVLALALLALAPAPSAQAGASAGPFRVRVGGAIGRTGDRSGIVWLGLAEGARPESDQLKLNTRTVCVDFYDLHADVTIAGCQAQPFAMAGDLSTARAEGSLTGVIRRVSDQRRLGTTQLHFSVRWEGMALETRDAEVFALSCTRAPWSRGKAIGQGGVATAQFRSGGASGSVEAEGFGGFRMIDASQITRDPGTRPSFLMDVRGVGAFGANKTSLSGPGKCAGTSTGTPSIPTQNY